MGSTLSIVADTIYTEGAISLALDIPLAALARARREKRLRFTRQGRRVLIRGAWVLAWLEADADAREKATPVPAGAA
jgi:hypothetical protein